MNTRSFAFRLRLLLVAVVLGVGTILYLYSVSPERPGRYPTCPLYQMTGLHCSGCGSLRCLHSLLHGDVRQALAYNAMTTLALPPLGLYGAWFGMAWVLGRPLQPRWRVGPWVAVVVVAFFLLFAIVRNLPLEPFRQLAPHKLNPALVNPA